MDFLQKYFSDINMIRVKTEIFALPYDKVSNEVMSLFTKNFSIFENFFQKVVDFNFFQYYFKEVKVQLAEIHPNLGHSSSLKEFNVLVRLGVNSLALKQVDFFQFPLKSSEGALNVKQTSVFLILAVQ